MTNPNPNNGPENFIPGGPPMVRIDGAAVRRIREESGLTQLYVATVVQVTTDTISRWENRRYPSIKKDNAEKLAEALGVRLEELLEREGSPPPETSATATFDSEPALGPPPPTSPALPPVRRWSWRLALVLLAAAVLVVAAWYRLAGHQEPLPVTATRILPAHVPPGQDFPVLLRVSSPPPASFALIIRESIPPGCRLTGAIPAATGPATGRAGQITWVSRLEGGERLFAYRLTSPTKARFGTYLRFQGQVVAGGRGEAAAAVTGSEQMTVAPYHWADRNGDNRIDDEEILWVYDLFGTLEGFDDLRDEVDRIWTAGGYDWDAPSGHYRVAK